MKFSTEELTALNSSQLLEKLDELRETARCLGLRWAEAEKYYKDLKELMPCFLAETQAYYLTPGANTTTARMRALADKTYQGKIKEMNIAEHEARKLEVEYKGIFESLKAITAIAYLRNREIQI